MTESIALALLKLLLAEAPGVLLWVLRQAGIVPSDATHSGTIEPMRRAADVLVTNPMVKAAEERESRAVREYVDAGDKALSGSAKGVLSGVTEWPPEYDKPESD